MINRRDTCEFKERCGRTGHFNDPVLGWVRCACLNDEINQRTLGQFYTPHVVPSTKLSSRLQDNLVIEGPLAEIRKHVARSLIDLREKGGTFEAFDAYRLVEIFLQKDDEFENQSKAALDKDLLILLLGFADIRNRMLPELIVQVLNRRSLLFKPTWVVLGLPYKTISTKYSQDVEDSIKDFGRLKVGS